LAAFSVQRADCGGEAGCAEKNGQSKSGKLINSF
jgi:hypothetical protein